MNYQKDDELDETVPIFKIIMANILVDFFEFEYYIKGTIHKYKETGKNLYCICTPSKQSPSSCNTSVAVSQLESQLGENIL